MFCLTVSSVSSFRKLPSIMHILCVVVILIAYVEAKDAKCDFRKNVMPGQTYYVNSPGYPNNYNAGVQCSWIAVCPTGYNCRINCQVNIPETTDCSMDRLLVSRTGDPQFASDDPYCGKRVFTAVSVAQNISIDLISSTNSKGGSFNCSVNAQVETPSRRRREDEDTDICACGIRISKFIVGGEETLPNEFPSMVALVERGTSNVMCGGVIISSKYVLTAAHCINNKNPSNLAVVVGEHDISSGIDSEGTRGYRVSNILTHPQFSNDDYDYDIALVTVEKNIEFDQYASPVCLPFKFANNDLTGEKLTIVGWGTLFIGGPTSDVLQKVEVDVISQDVCKSTVPNLTSRQICTFTPGKDACQFDSGGPLYYTDSETGLLFHAGIVSTGRLCASANEPGVNTRVTELLNWIEENAPDDYCKK